MEDITRESIQREADLFRFRSCVCCLQRFVMLEEYKD